MSKEKLSSLLPKLVCPDCRAILQTFKSCPCGTQFESLDDGTPKLFPQRRDATFTYNFSRERSVKTADFAVAFNYPPETKMSSKPYHLDDAHMHVLKGLSPNKTVLEIGCGGAQMRKLIEDMGHTYIGTDISKKRVHSFLQEHGGADILCDAHFLPIADEAVDVVYSIATSEHLAYPPLVAKNIAKCLKPGGIYLGNVSFLEPWHDDSFYHMTPLGVYELLAQARLNPLYIWPGRGWSGYKAIMLMGNKATKATSFLGSSINLIYSSSNKLKKSRSVITEQSRVAGAINWIAQKQP